MSAVPPQAISASILALVAYELRVYTLENGGRLIDAEDMQRLVAALEAGRVRLTPVDAKLVRDFLRGGTA